MSSSPVNKPTNKIRQIVRLKHIMQRWRHRCIPSSGNLAVYVGPERRRFIIPTKFINLPVFVSLLNKAEEEFGFQTTGGLIIPCDVGFFKRLVKVLERNENGVMHLDLDDFVAMFSDLGLDGSKHCKDCTDGTLLNSGSFTPLLRKTRV